MVVGQDAPTIIQPPLYKQRFTNAMERYFMSVPNKWTSMWAIELLWKSKLNFITNLLLFFEQSIEHGEMKVNVQRKNSSIAWKH